MIVETLMMEGFKSVIIFLVYFNICSASERKQCDIRVWYLNLITDDVFNVDLNDDQTQLKNSIETLVLNSAETPEARFTDCRVLYMYNDMLKEQFDYNSKKSRMVFKEATPEENSENGDGTANGDIDENINKDISDEIEKSPENNENTNTDNKSPTEHVNDEDSYTDSDDDGNNIEESNDDETDDSEIDETELFDESEIFEELDEEPIDKYKEDNQDNVDDNKPTKVPFDPEETFATKSIPDGVCWSFGCVRLDLFDVFSKDGIYRAPDFPFVPHKKEPTINENEDLNLNKQNIDKATKEQHVCELGSYCSNNCYYVLSPSFCKLGYTNSSNKFFNNSSEDGLSIDILNENVKVIKNGKNDEGTGTKVIENSEEIKTVEETINENQKQLTNEEIEEYEKEINEIIESTQDVDNSGAEKDTVNSKESKDIKNKVKPEDNIDIKKDNLKHNKEDEKTAGNENDKTNENNKDEDYKKENYMNDQIKETVETSKNVLRQLSLEEFENIIQKKTSEYAPKIQSLEIMIMKLENHLLSEMLNKQNHSSTITRLENLILKLENDLLKLNKNYHTLREEAENMNKRQNKYLEIADKQQSASNAPALSDKSVKNFELISQHQSKIDELTNMLRNQTSIISDMKGTHNYLEDQNRMLHQMIMNQTIFMTSIIKTVQDLSDQNSKNKQEINNLKHSLEKALDAKKRQPAKQTGMSIDDTNVIDDLDSLVFNNKMEREKSNEDNKDEDNDESEDDAEVHLKYYLAETNPEDNILSWCSANNGTCVYNTLIKAQCVPFRHIIWSSCKGKHKKQHTNNKLSKSDKYPNLPDVKDKKDNEENKLPAVKQEKDDTPLAKSTYEDMKNDNNLDEDIISKTLSDIIGYDKEGEPVYREVEEVKSVVEDDKENSNTVNDDKETKKGTITEKKTEEQIDIIKSIEVEKVIEDDKENSNKVNDAKETKSEILKEQKQEKQPDVIIDKKTDGIQDAIKEPEQKEPSAKQTGDSKGKSETKENKTDKPSKENSKEKLANQQKEPEQPVKDSKQVKTELKKESKDVKLESKPDTITKDEKSKEKPKAPVKQEEPKTAKAPTQKVRKTPINLATEKQREPKDCYDYYNRGNKKDGLYKVKAVGSDKMLEVFCDMRNGGWTVIQRRQDGTTNFFQEWDDYKKGFGGLYGEHWLGNDNIHRLSNQDYYKLRVDLMDFDKNKKHAIFESFLVEPEEEGYRLHIDGYSGDAGDGLTKHDGHKFSTKDVDNDKVVKEFGGSCAKRFHGAGWYYKCYMSNLNGKYYKGGKIPEKQFDGITWKPWTGPNVSMKKVEMKIKPASAKG